jgi:hypothetical protein
VFNQKFLQKQQLQVGLQAACASVYLYQPQLQHYEIDRGKWGILNAKIKLII